MGDQPEIAISGIHSGPDPSPGVGIALSLRDAFPDARLTGVDYSLRSSGLHHPVFDRVLLQPTWTELDLATHGMQIREHLDQPGGCWVSGLDVEIEWLAVTLGEHPRLLVPGTVAQQILRKPDLAAAGSLRMQVPEFLPAAASPMDLHELGRRSGWRLWVKGKYHEAYAAQSFREVLAQIEALRAHWPLEDIFVQRHVFGLERCIAFAAYQGRLLQAVEIEKRSVTPQGKTWAAAVTAVQEAVKERLGSFLAEVGWTGGGEVEFVRDDSGEEWLIDFNPRFPAYIYGVTICGYNLPAYLVGAALGIGFSSQRDPARQFVRVVQELPVRRELPHPRLFRSARDLVSVQKHPSFQPALIRRLRKPAYSGSNLPERSLRTVPTSLSKLQLPMSTPLRLRDFSPAEVTLRSLDNSLLRCAAQPSIIPAFSVKTDPQPEIARAFLKRGWWAEVISIRELEWALKIGFPASKIVFNGPALADFVSLRSYQVGVAFADSVETLEALVDSPVCKTAGLRLQSRAVKSRFGVDLTDFHTFTRVVHCLAHRQNGHRLGLHMHFASDICGPLRWNDLIEHTLVWAGALAEASGATVSLVDFGGGWHQDDFTPQLSSILPTLQSRIARVLGSVDTILLEPGRAVAAETAWLATRIIEVRSRGSQYEGDVVVDASVADLPMAGLYPHRVLHFRNDDCLGWLTGGLWRILGTICMEIDVLAEAVGFLQQPAAGDLLLFASAGGYNASMAWSFASGVSRDA